MESMSSSRHFSDGIAPMASLELVLVGRPFKVMSFLASGASVLMMVVGTASSRWMVTDRMRAGLWEECRVNRTGLMVCDSRPLLRAYSQACAVFALLAIAFGIAATVVLCLGMMSKDLRQKFRMYNITLVSQVFAVVCFLIPLIAYPIKFMQRVSASTEERAYGVWWECGWAYGMGWGGVIFLVASAFLLYLDKPSEELVYREKISKGSCLIEN